MLSVKQGVIKYHFLSLWYDSTQVSWAICKHFNHSFRKKTDHNNKKVYLIQLNLLQMRQTMGQQTM